MDITAENSLHAITSDDTAIQESRPPSWSGAPFVPPQSSAPIVISLISPPQSFNLLKLTEKQIFINELANLIGQIKPDTKWARKGDIFIYPSSNRQRNQLLALKAVKEFEISCSPARSERQAKGIVHQVPINNSEEELKALLSDQGVADVKRFTVGEKKTPITIISFTFSPNTPLPSSVIIAHERFPVKKFIPRPLQCFKCWKFGHIQEDCKSGNKCRKCAHDHPALTQCTYPQKCPTCLKSDHVAGTSHCPIFASRQHTINYAYANNISINEASRLLNNNQPQSHPAPVTEFTAPPNTTTMPTAIRAEFEAINARLDELSQQTANNTPHQELGLVKKRISSIEANITTLQSQVQPLLTIPKTITELRKEVKDGMEQLLAEIRKRKGTPPSFCTTSGGNNLGASPQQNKKDRTK